MILKIASWNIAGGHTVRSNKRFDYDQEENADYFIKHLSEINADVICLQESHWHPTKSLSSRIAAALKYQFVFETINSPSGIDPEFKESTAILSKLPLNDRRELRLPYPQFDMYLPDGKPAERWDKYLQVCSVSDIKIGNIHTQPLGYFNFDYHEEPGAGYAKEIELLLQRELQQPFILAGDFNTTQAEAVFRDLFENNTLVDALPCNIATRPNGNHIDYILFSPFAIKNASGIIETKTDHFLCWAEFAI